jgi:hypothetical protein
MENDQRKRQRILTADFIDSVDFDDRYCMSDYIHFIPEFIKHPPSIDWEAVIVEEEEVKDSSLKQSLKNQTAVPALRHVNNRALLSKINKAKRTQQYLDHMDNPQVGKAVHDAEHEAYYTPITSDWEYYKKARTFDRFMEQLGILGQHGTPLRQQQQPSAATSSSSTADTNNVTGTQLLFTNK